LEQAVEPREAILVAIRWAHAAAAVALVGGSAFYLTIVAPALRQGGTAVDYVRKGADAGFKELVDLSLVVFVVSGGLLTFERLSAGAASPTYVAILGLKVVLCVLLYRWAFQVRGRRGWDGLEAKLLVGSGFLVVLLAAVLKTLYEGGLRV
jgi:uncharacterized membrane protein